MYLLCDGSRHKQRRTHLARPESQALSGAFTSLGTPLHVADDQEPLGVLLASGASVKPITSRSDGTALIAAAHVGHDGVVKQLIAAGAPLEPVTNLHWTAAIEAVVLGNGGARH